MKVQVCKGRSCSEKGAEYIKKRLLSDAKKWGYVVTIEDCLCQWNCKNAPNLVIDGEIIERLNPVTASQILAKKILAAKQALIQWKWK